MMIYFLINNDYHLNLDLKLAKQLSKYRLGLIQVPYSLKIVSVNDLFSKVYHFPNKIIPSLIGIIFHPKTIKEIIKTVDEDLFAESADFLLVHTDMDFLNQYIIQKFHKAGAKIYLLEDGTATMCYYNTIPQKAALKDKIKTFIFQKFFNFKYSEIKKFGIETLPVMKDFVFKGVIVNFGDEIIRNIPLYKLDLFEKPVSVLYEDGAIFFSQPLYFWFLTEKEYINYLSELLAISKKFTPFYFKFHPSDTENVKFYLTQIINEKYSNITIIPENEIAEIIIEKFPVHYAITFNSTASFNLIKKGIVPIFLNDILNKTFPDTSFIVFNQFLKSIKCNQPSELSEVKPGFCAFLDKIDNTNSQSITEILNLK